MYPGIFRTGHRSPVIGVPRTFILFRLTGLLGHHQVVVVALELHEVVVIAGLY